jgi:hypothetical protein
VHLVPAATYLEDLARRFDDIPSSASHSRNSSWGSNKADDGIEDQENIPPAADGAANVQNSTVQDPLANMFSQIAVTVHRAAARGYAGGAWFVTAERGSWEMDEVSLHEEEAEALMVNAMTGGALFAGGIVVLREGVEYDETDSEASVPSPFVYNGE